MAELPRDRSPQFSVKHLLGLTAIVGVLLLFGIQFRDSRYLQALSSPWSLISFAILLAIGWLGYRRKSVGRPLRSLAVAIYALALLFPALNLGGDIVFGFMAWILSFMGVAAFAISFWQALASVAGGAANSCFVISLAARFIPPLRRRWPLLARQLALLGTTLCFVALLPLALCTELNALYPGFGLWAGSFLLLSLAVLGE